MTQDELIEKENASERFIQDSDFADAGAIFKTLEAFQKVN